MDDGHGISFTPHSVRSNPQGLDVFATCSYVYVYWVDLPNNRRCRVLPIRHFFNLIRNSKRPGVNVASSVMGMSYLNLADAEGLGFTSAGEYLYRFDMNSMKVLHGVGVDGPVAAVLGYFEYKDAFERKSLEAPLCPRTALKRVVDIAAKTYSVNFLVGFESEFMLLERNPRQGGQERRWVPASTHQFSSCAGLRLGSAPSTILHNIAESITKSGIQLEMYHAEAGPSQYEIVTGPLTPLEACDALIYTREIIANGASKHGLHATFSPKPYANDPGNSTHAHISLHSTLPESSKPSEEMSAEEKQFLSGVLAHLPSIAIFTLPIEASYKRAVDNSWSGGTYVSWGIENRETPIRLTNARSASSRNFELRFIDGTANPYIALASVIASGITGLRAKSELDMKPCNELGAAQMSEEQRKEVGIKSRMPTDLKSARNLLLSNKAIINEIGDEFVRGYLAANKTLDTSLHPFGEDEYQSWNRLVEFY